MNPGSLTPEYVLLYTLYYTAYHHNYYEYLHLIPIPQIRKMRLRGSVISKPRS